MKTALLAVAVMFTSAADCLTTLIGASLGATEANPIYGDLVQDAPVVFAALRMAFGVAVLGVGRLTPGRTDAIYGLASAAWAVAAAWNAFVIFGPL